MQTLKKVWVYADSEESRMRMCAGAKELGEEVSCLFIGDRTQLASAAALGADSVLFCENPQESRQLGDYSTSLAALVKTENPDLVLFDKSPDGRLLAAKLSASQGCCALSNIKAFRINDAIEVEQMIFGGSAIKTVRATNKPVFAVISAQLFPDAKRDNTATVQEFAFIEPEHLTSRIETRKKNVHCVDLGNAKRIVCIGRGVADEEDLSLIRHLAELLEAEIACTRPVSEVYGFLETERYVGITGVMFQPELFISIGISGQIQHMVGCNQSGYIMAINKDKSARIFGQSDFGIVADYKQILPQLINYLEG